jgi:hypothetical protein
MPTLAQDRIVNSILDKAQIGLLVFKYMRPITVTAGSNGMPANYQIKIVLDTASLISSGKMRSDCGDIRFYKADGTPLSYYIDPYTINTNNTVIWVKDPDALSANGSHTIYMYYGNPNVTSKSDGNATFIFFDDFLGTSIDTSKWVIEYANFSYSVSNSILYINLLSTADNLATTFRALLPVSIDNTTVKNYVFEAYVKCNGVPNPDTSWILSGLAVGRGPSSLGWDYNFIVGWEGYYDRFALHSWIGSMQSSAIPNVTNNTWYLYRLYVSANNSAQAWIGDNTATASWDIGTGTYYLRIGGQGSYSEYWYDYVRVRQYISPEPTVSVGNEQPVFRLPDTM